MEDLISEEEFLPKKDNYNPWKEFIVFYAISIVYYVVTTIIQKRTSNMNRPLSFLFAGIMFILPFVMILRKKKNLLLPVKTIFSSICVLMTILFLSNFIRDVLQNISYGLIPERDDFLLFLPLWGVLMGYGFICFLIILAIRRRKLKKTF